MQDLGASCIAFVALRALRKILRNGRNASGMRPLRICCIKISRNARNGHNARNELALNYTQGPWLRCLRCMHCVTLETGLKHRIMHMMPHDSPGESSFLLPKITAKFEWDHPLRKGQLQVGWVKICHFRRKTHYNSKTVQDRHTVSIKVE